MHLTREGYGRPAVSLTDEPPFCHALAARPFAREAELDRGLWLVIVVAAWSAPDVEAVRTAIDAVARFQGRVQLGVRPYDDPDEVETWCPELRDAGGSPMWAILDDGVVVAVDGGIRSADQLVATIKRALEAR
ncbi:MAG: hypothetical protein ACRDPA_26200 [Solirubrobacteraceae bacterium]